MSVFAIVGNLLCILMLSWALWFVSEPARYIINYGDEIDQRLRNVRRSI